MMVGELELVVGSWLLDGVCHRVIDDLALASGRGDELCAGDGMCCVCGFWIDWGVGLRCGRLMDEVDIGDIAPWSRNNASCPRDMKQGRWAPGNGVWGDRAGWCNHDAFKTRVVINTNVEYGAD